MSFTLQGVHHVGLTVSDMKRSFEWYSRMFGVVPGAVNHGSGPDLERGVGVEGAELTFSMIDIGNVNLEFLEYSHPDGKPFDSRNCDIGATHVCFRVDDMESAYSTLVERGAVFSGPTVRLPARGGPICATRTASNWRSGRTRSRGRRVIRTGRLATGGGAPRW
jgi:catechol 2,3-dioxygenase-like lactoylglutathione lyase family enzyme